MIKQDAITFAKLRTALGGTKVDISPVTLSNLIQYVALVSSAAKRVQHELTSVLSCSYYAQLSFAMTKFPDQVSSAGGMIDGV